MQVCTPEISYHDDIKPILSCDLHASGRMATGGADHMVRVWMVKQGADATAAAASATPASLSSSTSRGIELQFLANLEFHQKPVNVVRFSPDGQYLASASDDNWVIIWKREDDAAAPQTDATVAPPLCVDLTEGSPQPESLAASASASASSSTTTPAPPAALPFGVSAEDVIESAEKWHAIHKMRGHMSEIYDLSWSPNSQELITGSIDSHTLVWSLSSSSFIQTINEHSGFIQGVTWDPLAQYVATQSSDRSVLVYEKKRVKNKGKKIEIEFQQKYAVKTRPKIGGAVDMTAAVTTASDKSTLLQTPRKKLQPQSLNLDLPTESDRMLDVDVVENQPSFNNAMEVNRVEISVSDGLVIGDSPTKKAPVSEKIVKDTGRPLYASDHPSYFRRLAFSPDGNFLVTPAGQYHAEEMIGVEDAAPLMAKLVGKEKDSKEKEKQRSDSATKDTATSATPNKDASSATTPSDELLSSSLRSALPTCYIYHRSDLSKPIAHLPQLDPVVVVKFCPKLFTLQEKKESNDEEDRSLTCLPYRMVFSIATTRHILLYDTESSFPLAIIKNIHHSGLTDLSWSVDGATLVSSSSDGYCSYVQMCDTEGKNQLGEMLSDQEQEAYEKWWSLRRDHIAFAMLQDDSEKVTGEKGTGKKSKKGKEEQTATTAIVTLLGAAPAPLPSLTPSTDASSSSPSAAAAPSTASKVKRTDEQVYLHAIELLQNGERLSATRLASDCGISQPRAKKVVAEFGVLGMRAYGKMMNNTNANANDASASSSSSIDSFGMDKLIDFETSLCTELGVDLGVDLRTVRGRPCDPKKEYTLPIVPKAPKPVKVSAALEALDVAPTGPAPVAATAATPMVIDVDPSPEAVVATASSVSLVTSASTSSSTDATPSSTPLTSSTSSSSATIAATPESPKKQASRSNSPHTTPAKTQSASASSASPASASSSAKKKISTPSSSAKSPSVDASGNKKKRKSEQLEATTAAKPKTTLMSMWAKAGPIPKSTTNKTETKPSVAAASSASSSLSSSEVAEVVDLTSTMSDLPITQPRAKRRITPDHETAAAASSASSSSTAATVAPVEAKSEKPAVTVPAVKKAKRVIPTLISSDVTMAPKSATPAAASSSSSSSASSSSSSVPMSVDSATSISSLSPTRKRKSMNEKEEAKEGEEQKEASTAPSSSSTTAAPAAVVSSAHQVQVKKKPRKIELVAGQSQ